MKSTVYHFFPAKEALVLERLTSSQELLGGLDLTVLQGSRSRTGERKDSQNR